VVTAGRPVRYMYTESIHNEAGWADDIDPN
jgi:hypothetical protein